jgi:O-antigen ligase
MRAKAYNRSEPTGSVGSNAANFGQTSIVTSLALAFIAMSLVQDALLNKTIGRAIDVSSSYMVLISVFVLAFLRCRTFFSPKNLGLTAVVLWPLALLLIDYLYLSRYGPVSDSGGQGLRNAAYLVVVAVWFHSGTCLSKGKLPSFIYIPLFLAILYWAANSAIELNQQSSYGFAATKNDISGILVHLIFLGAFIFLMGDQDRWRASGFPIAIAGVLIISVLVGERALIPAALFATALYFVLRRFRPSFPVLCALFLLIMLGEVLLVGFISGLNHMSSFVDLNSMIVDITGRRLNSGREHVWSMISYYISINPWFGLGSGIQPSDVFESPVRSAHNSFLQVLMQVGIVGLGFLVLQMFLFWRSFGRIADSPLRAAALSYFVFVVFHASSESFLTNTNLTKAALVWINFGLLFSVGAGKELRSAAVKYGSFALGGLYAPKSS